MARHSNSLSITSGVSIASAGSSCAVSGWAANPAEAAMHARTPIERIIPPVLVASHCDPDAMSHNRKCYRVSHTVVRNCPKDAVLDGKLHMLSSVARVLHHDFNFPKIDTIASLVRGKTPNREDRD